MAPDLAVVDTRIRTLDPDRPWASAVAIEDGVIVAVGDTAEVREACDARTTVLSGANWHVTPGLTDGHQHLLMGAQVAQGINFDRVSTLAEVRALLRAERERLGPDAWITGFAFEYDALQGADYHHALVDEAAGPGPMLIHTLDTPASPTVLRCASPASRGRASSRTARSSSWTATARPPASCAR
jgi:predicted amidohydrolase YtcJ